LSSYRTPETQREFLTLLQSSSTGVSVKELMRRFQKSRHTIENWIAELENGENLVIEDPLPGDHHLIKRYRISKSDNATIDPTLLSLDGNDRAALERLGTANLEQAAKTALEKVLAGSAELGATLAINQADLINRHRHIDAIGPKLAVQAEVIETVEKSVIGQTEVRLLYRAQGKPRASWRQVRPFGLLYGRFGYLVASIKRGAPLLFRLDLIRKAESTTDMFEPKPNWDFKKWSSESFGIFHGDKLIDIKLRFKGEAAKRAQTITFHSSQKTEKGRNGTLVVYLRCRGHRELIHELSHPDWLDGVKIEEPDSLKEEMSRYCQKLTSVYT
jgi:predicted DNA-binding transcriptional regulator YafY